MKTKETLTIREQALAWWNNLPVWGNPSKEYYMGLYYSDDNVTPERIEQIWRKEKGDLKLHEGEIVDTSYPKEFQDAYLKPNQKTMNKTIKQTVYLPVKVERHRNHHIFDLTECEGAFIQNVAEESGYFFTPEQLNEYTANVIKQALEIAAENVDADFEPMGWLAEQHATTPFIQGEDYEIGISRISITNTFEETYQKLKV